MAKSETTRKRSVGRPQKLEDGDIVYICTERAVNKLQAESERRAVVQHLVNVGGRCSIGELNAHFEYDVRAVVLSLIRSRWFKALPSAAPSRILPPTASAAK